jgi:predicted ATP-grasp superfamily ATP-dependent carboligase
MEIERIPFKILAIGYSVRHIVCSGFPLNPLQLHADVKHLKAEIEEADGIIIGSGFESADFGFLTVKDRKKIVGNTPEKTREVSNKAWLSSRLDDLGWWQNPFMAEGERLISFVLMKRS